MFARGEAGSVSAGRGRARCVAAPRDSAPLGLARLTVASEARRDESARGVARPGTASLPEACQGEAWPGVTRRVRTRLPFGAAGLGRSWRGSGRPGRGVAPLPRSWQDEVWPDQSWQHTASQDQARRVSTGLPSAGRLVASRREASHGLTCRAGARRGSPSPCWSRLGAARRAGAGLGETPFGMARHDQACPGTTPPGAPRLPFHESRRVTAPLGRSRLVKAPRDLASQDSTCPGSAGRGEATHD